MYDIFVILVLATISVLNNNSVLCKRALSRDRQSARPLITDKQVPTYVIKI